MQRAGERAARPDLMGHWALRPAENFCSTNYLESLAAARGVDAEALASMMAFKAEWSNRFDAVQVGKVYDADWSYSDEGEAPDVGRYLEGEPECWFVPTAHSIRRIVRVAFEVGLSAKVSDEVLTQRGAAAAALVDALESRGFGVDLTAITALQYGTTAPECLDHVRAHAVQVKGADQPLDVPRMLFVMAHPGFFRQLEFARLVEAGMSPARLYPLKSDLQRAHVYGGYDVAIPSTVGGAAEVLATFEAFLLRIQADVSC